MTTAKLFGFACATPVVAQAAVKLTLAEVIRQFGLVVVSLPRRKQVADRVAVPYTCYGILEKRPRPSGRAGRVR